MLTSWHHPHLIKSEETDWGTTYQFRPFTGDEPEPEVPEEVHSALMAEQRDSEDLDSPNAPWRRLEAIRQEVRAALNLWEAARYAREIAEWLRELAHTWQAYQREKKAVDAAYAALDDTADSHWRAALLRLTAAREAALAAADHVDRGEWRLSALRDRTPERVLEAAPEWRQIAQTAGVDIADWDYWSADSDRRRRLESEFLAQDRRLGEVRRLVGESS